MDNLCIKKEKTYKFGVNVGFFTAFLLFASVIYLMASIIKKMPLSVKYYHVVLFVAIVYSIGFVIMKLKK